MVQLLTLHTQAVHATQAPQAAQMNSVSKLEKLPRPTFTLKMSESHWNYTKLQWDDYITQAVVSPTIQFKQLQASCDSALRQRVFDTGTYASLNTSDLFMQKMKELSVISVHKSIHLMNVEDDSAVR